MKVIYHAILDGKFYDVITISDILRITHGVESTWFGSRHIRSRHQNVTQPYDVWRLRYNYSMQIAYTCEKEKKEPVITNNYIRHTLKMYARIADADKITLNSVETF